MTTDSDNAVMATAAATKTIKCALCDNLIHDIKPTTAQPHCDDCYMEMVEIEGPREPSCCPARLQQLVLDHDGYDKIPEWAWQSFEAEMEVWKADVRSGVLHRKSSDRE